MFSFSRDCYPYAALCYLYVDSHNGCKSSQNVSFQFSLVLQICHFWLLKRKFKIVLQLSHEHQNEHLTYLVRLFLLDFQTMCKCHFSNCCCYHPVLLNFSRYFLAFNEVGGGGGCSFLTCVWRSQRERKEKKALPWIFSCLVGPLVSART